MKLKPTQLALALTSAVVLTLAGCGGGGGSSSGDMPVATSGMVTVSPALGKFSAGAKITIKNLSGTTVGTGTTDSTGTATINIGSHSGAMLIEVTGGPGVTYFDENHPLTPRPFGASDTLSAIAPAVQGTIGVTAATNAAVAYAKYKNGGGISAAMAVADINLANSKIAAALGITDVLQAPKLVDATSPLLDMANVQDKYALQLAALAKLAVTGTALDVANDLASDLKDDMLDGRFTPVSGTAVLNLATTYDADTITTVMAIKLKSAAKDFGTADTKKLVEADSTILGTVMPNVTTIVTPPLGTNATDLQKVKAFFAELRTTLRSLSNSTKSGFLDSQASRASTDLTNAVAPSMDKIVGRLDAIGMAMRLSEGTQSLQQRGSIFAVWSGTGGFQSCIFKTPGSSSSVVTCEAASADGADHVNNLIKFIYFDLTPTGSGAYTYSALRYNKPVTAVNGYSITLGSSVGANGTCLATHATNGTNDGSCGGTITKGATNITLTGTFPPSTPSTGIDTVALTAAKTTLSATTSRYALTGSVSTANAATPTSTVALSLDSGSQIDVDETNVATTGLKAIAFTLKGTAQTNATKFVGTVTASAFDNDATGGNYAPSNVAFLGAVSDMSSGGAVETLTGKLDVAITGRSSYNGTLNDSASNYAHATMTFTGTVQAPSRPLMKLVVSGTRTAFDTTAVTLNYTYGTVSITGSGTSSPTGTITTLSNQDGVQLAPNAGNTKTMVTKSGSALAEIQNGTIKYVDGFTESAL